MKKIFAIALVGLISLTFVENANAFESDNSDVVYSIGEYDAPVDVITFEIVPVATEFADNVAVLTVNSTNLGGFLASVPIDAGDSFNSLTVNTSIDSSTFVDLPIDYGICSTNEFEVNETTNLAETVKEYNYTNGYASPEIVKDIATNVGKLTSRNL